MEDTKKKSNSGNRKRKRFNPKSRNGEHRNGERSNRNGGFRSRRRSGGFNKSKSRRKTSAVDPQDLIKKAVPVEETVYHPQRKMGEMPIHFQLKETLNKKGYKLPTEIQDRTLEQILAGRDLLGLANTGTGKTGAFLIPIIHHLLESNKPFQTLIMLPTRELAEQVDQEFKSMTKGLKLFSACFIGGTGVYKDLKKLRKFNHVVIGTPGRLTDLYNRGALRLEKFSVLILDEFDRMLDMGFSADVELVKKAMVKRNQTLLFSATIDKTQQPIIDDLLNNPVEVKVCQGTVTGDHIEQDIIKVPEDKKKIDVLVEMMNQQEFKKVIVFAETKRWVSRVHDMLRKSGIRVDEIHGDKSQMARKKALEKFKRGNVKVLVATDVAARGIDVSDVSHVINYQLPQNMESYIHRIGRTGRAGKGGKAFTFVN